MFVISNSFLGCFFSSISHFFSFYVAVSMWHAVPNSTHFWCLIKSIENNKSFMEDQICGNNINSNLFILLPKSNFHKSFLPMGFQQLIPKLQFVLIKTNIFFQFESFWLRIQFDQNIYALLTKEPIYRFLKKFVNKQKIIKKITISRLRIGCWHPRRKIKICYSVLIFAGSMCCIPLFLRGHGHQMIVRPHPFFLQKFSFYSWDKLASGPTRTQFVYIAIFVSLCWCGLKFERKH